VLKSPSSIRTTRLVAVSLLFVFGFKLELVSAAWTEGAISDKPALSLNGDWQVAQMDKEDWIPATVPGNVHTDLMKAGEIPDPFFRDNADKVKWVGEADWIYKRQFQVPDDLLKRDRVLLRCDGLDTLATVTINGKEAGKADNMFRVWEYDVKSLLRPGANEIAITFGSPFPYMNSRKPQWLAYANSLKPQGKQI